MSIWWIAKRGHLLSDLIFYKGIQWSHNSLHEDGMKLMHYNKYFKVGWVPEVFLLQTLITTLVELTWRSFFSYYPHPAQDSECFLN